MVFYMVKFIRQYAETVYTRGNRKKKEKFEYQDKKIHSFVGI